MTNQKVLVVDDDLLAQEYVKAVLSKKYEVHTAGNVNSFYEIISKIKFDLIIMDLSLRDYKSGFELTEELKSDRKYKKIPIFILTAFGTIKEKQTAFEVGADKFLTKPANTSTFVKLVELELNKTSAQFGSYNWKI